MPFQVEGVNALVSSERLLLADDMGLGKTLQTIAAARILKAQRKIASCLVVAPSSLLDQWRREIEKWAPELSAIIIRGSLSDRATWWKARPGGPQPPHRPNGQGERDQVLLRRHHRGAHRPDTGAQAGALRPTHRRRVARPLRAVEPRGDVRPIRLGAAPALSAGLCHSPLAPSAPSPLRCPYDLALRTQRRLDAPRRRLNGRRVYQRPPLRQHPFRLLSPRGCVVVNRAKLREKLCKVSYNGEDAANAAGEGAQSLVCADERRRLTDAEERVELAHWREDAAKALRM